MKKDNASGAIPASVSIDIGPKYRVHIDENDSSSIEAIKRLVNSEPVISQTELTTITTEIISILAKTNIVPAVHINTGPHIDIIRVKHAQNTETEKETKSK